MQNLFAHPRSLKVLPDQKNFRSVFFSAIFWKFLPISTNFVLRVPNHVISYIKTARNYPGDWKSTKSLMRAMATAFSAATVQNDDVAVATAQS